MGLKDWKVGEVRSEFISSLRFFHPLLTFSESGFYRLFLMRLSVNRSDLLFIILLLFHLLLEEDFCLFFCFFKNYLLISIDLYFPKSSSSFCRFFSEGIRSFLLTFFSEFHLFHLLFFLEILVNRIRSLLSTFILELLFFKKNKNKST
jgi:hypothetical protein